MLWAYGEQDAACLPYTRSDIVSAKQHGAVGLEQSSVQLLGSSEFYHQPVRVKYPAQCRLGEVARLSGVFQRIHGDDAHHRLTTQLA
jgi:hypothetical protein